ncbi:hypothetical protein LX36DRAFT_653735 [Colletotrichum falcatum]|nr:hypothetical protein LX36DRAFT_653735 [Colletotrichum falcatum]
MSLSSHSLSVPWAFAFQRRLTQNSQVSLSSTWPPAPGFQSIVPATVPLSVSTKTGEAHMAEVWACAGGTWEYDSYHSPDYPKQDRTHRH